MARMSTIKAKVMIKFLESLGFELIRQRGSHKFFKHPDGRTATVPDHRGEDLGRGITTARLTLSPSTFLMSMILGGVVLTGKTTMICDICGQAGVRIRRVSRSYGKGEQLLVIENVPVVSCPHCGESYLTAETLHELERIKLHRQRVAVERPVAVAAFA